MKQFFGITKERYEFEIFDITTVLTIFNVALILCGWRFAPVFGLVNCVVFLVLNVKSNAHINSYLTQISLIILNCYFLTM